MKARWTNFLTLKALGLLSMVTLAILLMSAMSPSKAHADEIVAHTVDDSGNTVTNFYSHADAIAAGYSSNNAVVMDCDWEFYNTLTIAEGRSITIDMNGHRIVNNGYQSVIRLKENSNLTLKANEDSKTTFSYKGYSNEDGSQFDGTIETGGLVTGGNTEDETGGILMDKSSSLTIDNVAIAGNIGDDVGGIFAKEQCKIYMKNDGTIQNNKGKSGGIFVDGAEVNIEMEKSSVCYNYGTVKTGGINVNANHCSIKMEKESSISYNFGDTSGALFFNWTFFSITSADKTGTINNNVASASFGGGGAIDTDIVRFSENEGMISGLTIKDNVCKSKTGAGAMYLTQRWTQVVDCTITGNKTESNGAGIKISGSECCIIGCTIKDNICGVKGNGAGVYVHGGADVRLSGKCYICGNYNKGKTKETNFYIKNDISTSSYIKCGVDSGSKIGIGISETGDCRFGKEITNYTYGTYFMDDSGYYVTKGNDYDGDLWQRKGRLMYAAKVGGVGQRHYEGETITVNKKSSPTNKRFWYWDATKTTGLYPVEDYINEATMYNNAFTYTMPQNDVNLIPVEADCVTLALLHIDKPVAGEALTEFAAFRRTDKGVGGQVTLDNVAIKWYEVTADGSKIEANGTAQAGKTYVARVSIEEQQKLGLFFSENLSANDVIVFTDAFGVDKIEGNTVSVDSSTSTLNIETAGF